MGQRSANKHRRTHHSNKEQQSRRKGNGKGREGRGRGTRIVNRGNWTFEDTDTHATRKRGGKANNKSEMGKPYRLKQMGNWNRMLKTPTHTHTNQHREGGKGNYANTVVGRDGENGIAQKGKRTLQDNSQHRAPGDPRLRIPGAQAPGARAPGTVARAPAMAK